MDVALRGSSPAAMVCGILLLTRSRQLGLPLRVTVEGRPDEITPVLGPAVAHTTVLASCGVGREGGAGGTIVVPGPPENKLLVSLDPEGATAWFAVDPTGHQGHPATIAFLRLGQDPRIPARKLGKDLRRAMEALGMAAEPAVLDLLFGAPAAPLTRLSLALRAGRSLSGNRGEPITRYLAGQNPGREALAPGFDAEQTDAALRSGGLQWIVDGLSMAVRSRVEEWLETARMMANEDEGRDLALVQALAELGSHLVQLPSNSMLPPLNAGEDGVATCLKAALSADGGEPDANQQLANVFRFLGGRFSNSTAHAWTVSDEQPPETREGIWGWFCREALRGRTAATDIWPQIVDPPQ